MKSVGFKASLILVVMALCVMFPIWQSSKTTKLEARIASLESRISDLNEEELEINSIIAKQTSPEYVISMASQKGIKLNQVGSQNSSSVALNF